MFRCADGYASSLPLRAALDPSVLLAIAQNGEPLAWEHGFPCRVRAPAFYGVKNAKWLQEIELVPFEFKDYWTIRGWSDTAVVRTESPVLNPAWQVSDIGLEDLVLAYLGQPAEAAAPQRNPLRTVVTT